MLNFLRKFSKKEKKSDKFCPNCKTILEAVPVRKTKCKVCGEFIYTRTDPNTQDKLLVTESEKEKIDLEWEEVRVKNNWLKILNQYGVTEIDFKAHKEQMIKCSNSNVNSRDVIWSLLGKLVHKEAEKMNFSGMSQVQYSQALFCNEEGRDPFKILQESNHSQLLGYKREGHVTHVEILSGSKSCVNCQKNNGVEYTLEEAISESPLPCNKCEFILDGGKYPFCRCIYTVKIK